jgi:adenylate cyclase
MIGGMPREIERKFLLQSDAWRALAQRHRAMSQGYIAGSERVSVRVRVAGNEAHLNIKSGGLTASRLEYEYAIPVDEARELLRLCPGALVEKTRHYVDFGGFEWEVDEFHGANDGLVVAELELDSEDQVFPRPAWLGKEVTHLRRYYNVSLVEHPFSAWTDAERSP